MYGHAWKNWRVARLTQEGVLVITAQRYRTQDRNRQDALERMVHRTFPARTPTTRIRTHPGAGTSGGEERHAALWSAQLREHHIDLRVAKSVDHSVVADSILSVK
jgi:protein subunit release factor B